VVFCLNHTPADLACRGEPVPIAQKAGCVPGQSGGVRKISHPQGFDRRTLHSVVSSYTDCCVLNQANLDILNKKCDVRVI
jgi:hypothetical protein